MLCCLIIKWKPHYSEANRGNMYSLGTVLVLGITQAVCPITKKKSSDETQKFCHLFIRKNKVKVI